MGNLVIGNLVKWINGPRNNIGVVAAIDSKDIAVVFDSGEVKYFAVSAGVLVAFTYNAGDFVQVKPSGLSGVVIKSQRVNGLYLYEINMQDGTHPWVDEKSLRPYKLDDPIEMLRAGELHGARATNLRISGSRLYYDYKYNEFSSLSNSRVEIKPHQVGVLHRVTTSYPIRYLLADEVGLGKTVEAGMIISELVARDLVKRILIIAPSGITRQWQMELRTKFSLAFSLYNRDTVEYLKINNPQTNIWTLNPYVITSSSFATHDIKRIGEIVSAGWDMVIIDEAHHARRTWVGQHKHNETDLYKLAEQLAGLETGAISGLLLLTATPMQLHQYELYSLIELLDPALYSTYDNFEENRKASARINLTVDKINRWPQLDEQERISAKHDAALLMGESEELLGQKLDTALGRSELTDHLFLSHKLSEIMIRNRKQVVGGFMPRVPVIWPVDMTPEEMAAYNAVNDYIRNGYTYSQSVKNNSLGFLMVVFQKLSSSSSRALSQALQNRMEKLAKKLSAAIQTYEQEENDIEEMPVLQVLSDSLGINSNNIVSHEIQQLAQIVTILNSIPMDSKIRVLRNGLKDILKEDPSAKVIIFTQFRETQDYIAEMIPGKWSVFVYHGQLKRQQKDDAVSNFKTASGPSILVSTESGGEGRNFQFCHMMVNYDLPWNPMKVEQRIGRLDRIGQKQAVKIFNFKLNGTIEERVLDVLQERIKIFEETVGGLDPILGEVEKDIQKIFLTATDRVQQEFDRWEKQLEKRVQDARLMETRLHDLIMDTKSMRKDEVQKLLDRENILDFKSMRSFVLGILNALKVKIEKDQKIDGVYCLSNFDHLLVELGGLPEAELPDRVIFEPAIALDHESIEFLAFGNPLIERLIDYVRSKDYPGKASYRLIKTDEKEPQNGWLIIYLIEIDGIQAKKELYPVYISIDGQVDQGLAAWLLDRACQVKFEENNLKVNANDNNFEAAVSVAESNAIGRRVQLGAEAAEFNTSLLMQQRAKLNQIYAHREKAISDKINATRQIYERVSSSADPEVQKITPVWAKNLENVKKYQEQLIKDKQRDFHSLETHENVTIRHQVFSASYIDIVPAQSVGDTTSLKS